MPSLRSAPILCYITDRRSLPLTSSADALAALPAKIAVIAEAGADWIQIREKDLSSRAVAKLARDALRGVASCGSRARRQTRILVNDRLDIALAEGAGGVHLAENSIPMEEAGRLVRLVASAVSAKPDFLIGVSTHSLSAAAAAAASAADYVIFGPIFPTPSKSTYGDPQGLARLAEVCDAVKIPVVAIGGITAENAHLCRRAGAAGIAAIRMFQDAADPGRVVRELRDRLR